MKKFLILMLALVLILGLSACGEKEPPQFDIPTLQAQSEAVIEALLAGDYTTVTGYFDATMSKQLSAETLSQTWEMITGPIGAYQETTWAMRARCRAIISCARCWNTSITPRR